MAFDRSALRLACCASCAALSLACAHDPRVFALRAPVLRDQDLDLVRVDCPKQPATAGVKAAACAPELYESSFSWDAADMSIFRPMTKLFQVDSYGEAENVNAFDEVPDSSWFVNRIGAQALSPEAVCATDLARSTNTFAIGAFHFGAQYTRGTADPEPTSTTLTANGETCVSVPEAALAESVPDDAKERYVTLRISNGVAPGPLLAHFYDLGRERGLRLVGIERPGS